MRQPAGGAFAAAALSRRLARIRQAMAAADVDALLLSLGADLPWLTGYHAMPLERLTMLVLPADAEATMLVPALEAPRVVPHDEVFSLRPWQETEDAVAIVADLVGNRRSLAVSDRTWASVVLALQAALPGASWRTATSVTAALRAVKDDAEVAALSDAARAADRVAVQLLDGAIPLVGRTEASVSADIGRRLIDEGHDHVNFAIVACGPNAASPHHDPGARVIGAGEVVVCDFGGSMAGYCSDITRTVVAGGVDPSDEFAELYRVLERAQTAGVGAAKVGTTCEAIDAVPRAIIAAAGYGDRFIHRTGHGIGLEEHEDPYIVSGNRSLLVAGHAFSVEPGIYLAGRFGARIEDIVVASDSGPRLLNHVDRRLTVVDA